MSNVICEHCGFQEMNSKLSAENKRLKARNAELEDIVDRLKQALFDDTADFWAIMKTIKTELEEQNK